MVIDNWALGIRAKNDLVELIDHQTIASQSTIPNVQSNLYWISYMKSSFLRILWYVTDTICIMLQMKKIIINHCALRRYFAVDFMFFVNSVLPFLLKFISTHCHIQKQREKIEENPTEKMNCNRYNKITYAEFFPMNIYHFLCRKMQ